MTAINPQLVLNRRYTDMWNFCEAIGWDIEFRQLDVGQLDAHATVIAGHDVQIVKFNLDKGFHQLGAGPEGMLTFGILDVDIPKITWCSEDMPGGTMANFNMDSGFDCVSGAGFKGYGILLKPELLQRLAEQSGAANVEKLARQNVNWNSATTLALGRRLGAICREAVKLGSEAINEQSEFINYEIGFAVIQELTRGSSGKEVIRTAHRAKVLRKALEILDDPDELPVPVSELCERSGTSPATLHRIFLSEYGVPPKAYIRSRCLSAVRDKLAHVPLECRVSDVANRWGFWHMGQFAKDYFKLFGELPSQTLIRSAK